MQLFFIFIFFTHENLKESAQKVAHNRPKHLIFSNVTYAHLPSAADGWQPEWVKLVLKDYHILKCSFDGASRMDGNDLTEPTFLDFVCKPEGTL